MAVSDVALLGTLAKLGATGLGGLKTAAKNVSRTWPKHHPFPKYLGGAVDQTLRKMPRKLHEQFHAALDKWKGGKYARANGAEHFKGMNKNEIIRDLREFYRTGEGGIFKDFLPDFERALKESGR